jgi:aryl sulfotransferase
MNGIIWLASYPKSGNTWIRAFMSGLLGNADEDISINQMKTDAIFSSRPLFDIITGIESSNLTADEIDGLRPMVYNYLAKTSKRPLFIKVHDAYTYLEDGTPLLGTANAKAIYILRNPLDVAVSFANHASQSINRIITDMSNADNAFCGSKTRLPNQTRQKLLSWSAHVESWANAKELPVYFIRYEDMKADPVAAFTGALRFIGLCCTEEQIKQAVELSSFERLKAEEDSGGFKEKPYNTASFFRAGRTGDWRNHLSDEQRDRIIAENKAVMSKYGYLDETGSPTY